MKFLTEFSGNKTEFWLNLSFKKFFTLLRVQRYQNHEGQSTSTQLIQGTKSSIQLVPIHERLTNFVIFQEVFDEISGEENEISARSEF